MERSMTFSIVKALRAGEASLTAAARRAGISLNAAHTYLTEMQRKGILSRKEIGRTHLYMLNQGSFLARHLKILLSLDELNESGIVEEIRKRNYSVISIILYGSVARGDDDEKSDIDILVIARKKQRLGGLAVKSLKRQVSIEQYTPSEWRATAKTDKIFYDKVIVDGIALYGEIPVVL